MIQLEQKHHLIKLIVILLFALVASQISAADYLSSEFQDAYQAYLAVSSEQGGSAKALAKTWETIAQENQQDPLALVLLGSSHTLMGRDAWMPWSKLRHTEKGLEEMAMAQRLITEDHKQMTFDNLPVDLQVKTTAAITFTQVPEMFGRHEEGFYLFEDILTDPALATVPAPAVTYIYYFAINAALQIEKTEHAMLWKTQLEALAVDDDYTKAALELGF